MRNSFDELETLFLKLLADIEDFLPYLVLVGGWVPNFYIKYLWKNLVVPPIVTTDIDFGLSQESGKEIFNESIYKRLSRLKYRERHLNMDRMFPVVPILSSQTNSTKILIEFISSSDVTQEYIEALVGKEIIVNKIENFHILMSDYIEIQIGRQSGLKPFKIKIPPPYLFLFHKAITFITREDESKIAKDLFYAYYILRFHPNKEKLLSEVKSIPYKVEKRQAAENIRQYFSRISDKGCLMVEEQNGPDAFVFSVREDAHQRFSELFEALD